MQNNEAGQPFCIFEHFPHLCSGDNSVCFPGHWRRKQGKHPTLWVQQIQPNIRSQGAVVSPPPMTPLLWNNLWHLVIFIILIVTQGWGCSEYSGNLFLRGNGLTILPSEAQTGTHLALLEGAPRILLGSKYLFTSVQLVCNMIWTGYTLKSDSCYVSKYLNNKDRGNAQGAWK